MDKKSLLVCHFAWHIGDGLNVKARPYWRGQLCVRRSLLSRLCERRQLKNNLPGGWAPLLSLLSSPVRSEPAAQAPEEALPSEALSSQAPSGQPPSEVALAEQAFCLFFLI